MKISIILPSYNEAGNIDKLIFKIITVFKDAPYTLEFIVIDDNSPDGTAKVISRLIKKKLPVRLFVRKNQRGLATAILRGLKKATGETIVLMDTDFNHQPKDVLRLVKNLEQKNADIVIGSRYISQGGMHKSEAGTLQFFASKYGSLLVSKILLKLPVNESLSGFLALKKTCLNKLNLDQIFQGYGEYCIRLLYHLYKQNFILTEIPVVYGKRQYGVSKSRLYKMFIEYFKTALSLKFKP